MPAPTTFPRRIAALAMPARSRWIGWAMAACACASPAAQAQIFRGTDDRGEVVLSNHAMNDDDEVLVAAPPAPPPRPAPPPPAAPSLRVAVLPEGPPPLAAAVPAAPVTTTASPSADLTEIIARAARRHAVPAAILHAVVAVESGFDGRAVSPKGAKGLMQLMPDTARRFGVKDVFSPEDNVRAGAAYLRRLLDQFPDDLALALAAYNAGEGAVMKAGRRIPPYPETQRYVQKVLHLAARWPEPDRSGRR